MIRFWIASVEREESTLSEDSRRHSGLSFAAELDDQKGGKLWSLSRASSLPNEQEVDMSESKTESKVATDHEQIKRWVEERGGHPARVKGTAVEGSSGVLLIDYPGYSGTQTLEIISWDEFFQGFEENKLAFLYQDKTQAGNDSRFSKLISRDSAEKGRGVAK